MKWFQNQMNHVKLTHQQTIEYKEAQSCIA